MRIGFLTAASRFSQARHTRLLRSFELLNINAEWHNPFGEYDQIVVESGAMTRGMSNILERHKSRGKKIILHLTEATCSTGAEFFDAIVCNDASQLGTQLLRHKEFRNIEAFQIDDGVEYTPEIKAPSKPIRRLVWFGPVEDVGSLTTIEPFLATMSQRGATLTVLVDDPSRVDVSTIATEVKPFSDDILDYDMAVLPCGNPWSIKTAWVRNLPTLYVDFDDLYHKVTAQTVGEPFALCKGVEKPSNWHDYLDLHELSQEMFQNFRTQARRWVIDTGLIQNQSPKWIRVFEFCNTERHSEPGVRP